MTSFRLNRRAMLLGAGGVAIGLPWLEIMAPERSAHAATTRAKRLLNVYTPGGTILDQWTPTGTETSFALSPILAPLEPVKGSLVVMGDLDMKSAIGDSQQGGMIALLTGTGQKQGGLWGSGPSIDQVIAPQLAPGATSLYFAVRWGTGKGNGMVSPTNILCFDTKAKPIAPDIDPKATWQRLFGASAKPPNRSPWDASILDLVDKRYVKLNGRLGAQDKQRLDQHLTRLRELENAVAAAPIGCSTPAFVETPDYVPGKPTSPSVNDPVVDAAIPQVGKLMMDMMVMAFACDMAKTGTLQWSDSEAQYTCPWLGLPEHQNYYENDGGYHPIELQKIFRWYSTQHVYLLQQMAKIDMGGHSLLDESVVFFGSQIQNPATSQKFSMPFLLAGGGGGLKGNRYRTYGHRSHNDLLSAICNLFGDLRTTFGDTQFCTTPIDNLLT